MTGSTHSPLARDIEMPVVPKRALLTDDAEAILKFAVDGFQRIGSSALVTLTSIKGGAARAVGAQMAVHGDGAFCGFVSGGCTEAAVAAEALAAMEAGEDRFLHLGEGSPFFDIVLPCGGAITLYIHVIREIASIEAALASLAARKTSCLRFDPDSRQMSHWPNTLISDWQDSAFYRSYRPKTRLLICGQGIEAEVTARLANAAGFETELIGRASALDAEMIDDNTAVALLYHDINAELPILQAALGRNPFYLGALGSSRTHARRCEALWGLGYDVTHTARIRAPIGLVPKAKDASTLGLSILAEIAAVRNETVDKRNALAR